MPPSPITNVIVLCLQVIRSELVPYLIKCFHRLFPVPSAAALGAANAVSKEIESLAKSCARPACWPLHQLTRLVQKSKWM